MRIAVVCNDTRGGVQPYVALALGLRAAGHEVRAVAPMDLAGMFDAVGIPAAALSGNLEAVLRGSGGAAENGMVASMRLAAREMPRRVADWTRETLVACEGADLLTGGVGGMIVGLSVAEKLGKPFIPTHLQPICAPTDRYAGVLTPWVPAWTGRAIRRLSHRVSDAMVWMPFRGAMQQVREDLLGLRGRPKAADGLPVIYGLSRHVVDMPSEHVTGYWTLEAPSDWTPPAELEAFLRSPKPVVSIGFGSMASGNAEAVTELVRRAVGAAGLRAVLLTGWGGMEPTGESDDLHFAPAIPHDWLFPRMAAAVHHGGAGTTAAGLRAGVPNVVIPFTMDQPFWGGCVAELGVGPRPIPRRRLTAERLAAALVTAVRDFSMRERAAALGAKLRAEDGVGAAVRIFNRV